MFSSLTNENNETFNFGVKDGVRGFFTNPSRADDSFIPFKSNEFENPPSDVEVILTTNTWTNHTEKPALLTFQRSASGYLVSGSVSGDGWCHYFPSIGTSAPTIIAYVPEGETFTGNFRDVNQIALCVALFD